MTSRKADNRARMPETAAIFDSLRAAGIAPAWGRFREGGHSLQWGTRLPDRSVPPVPGLPSVRRPVAVIASPSSAFTLPKPEPRRAAK